MRKIEKTYADPLALVWIHAAAQMGIRIERSAEVNASWNGAGVFTIGTPETLEADAVLLRPSVGWPGRHEPTERAGRRRRGERGIRERRARRDG